MYVYVYVKESFREREREGEREGGGGREGEGGRKGGGGRERMRLTKISDGRVSTMK